MQKSEGHREKFEKKIRLLHRENDLQKLTFNFRTKK